MDISNLPGLPLVVAAAAAVIAEAVTGLLALFAAPIASIPGFRPGDSTRNALMRGLVALLNLAGLVGFAWTQNVVIPRAALPALLAVAAGQGLLAHFSYVGAKAVATRSTSSSTTVTGDTDTTYSFASASSQQVSTPSSAGSAL